MSIIHANIESARNYLESRMRHYLQILRSMVEINSFTGNREGVEALADLTVSLFEREGFSAERFKSMHSDAGRHLVLTRKGLSGSKIGLLSHLDTVFPPEEESRNNFTWRIESDRAYGPGTNDIKGGTVIMYMMLEALKHISPSLYNDLTWHLLFDATEETESDDFGELCRSLLEQDGLACLVFEGGGISEEGFALVASRKGRAVFRVSTEGKGAHSGVDHHLGANAIVQMSHVLGLIHGLTDYERELTFNIGTVSGGTVINRVPHSCEAWVELRAYSPEALEEGIKKMLSLNGYSSIQSADKNFRCVTSIELVRKNPSWPRNEGTNRLISCFRDAAGPLGITIIPEDRGGISDGNLLWNHLPTIDGLGPAGGNSHCSERLPDGSKDQEYAMISSFVPKALLGALGIMQIVSQGKYTGKAPQS